MHAGLPGVQKWDIFFPLLLSVPSTGNYIFDLKFPKNCVFNHFFLEGGISAVPCPQPFPHSFGRKASKRGKKVIIRVKFTSYGLRQAVICFSFRR